MENNLYSKIHRFRLHSIAVELSGPGAENLLGDFGFYLNRPNSPHRYLVSLSLENRRPAARDIPKNLRSRPGAGCLVYQSENNFFYQYNDQALLCIKRGKENSRGCLITEEAQLNQKLGQLYFRNEIGRFLDAQGLHRLQALALGLPNGSAALVANLDAPTNQCLQEEISQSAGLVLLSPSTSLLDRIGRVHAFPLGIVAKAPLANRSAPNLPLPRFGLEPLHLPRPEDHFRPGYLLLANRKTFPELEITDLPRWQGARALVKDAASEFDLPKARAWLRRGKRMLPELVPLAASRLAATTAFLLQAKCQRLHLTGDPRKNSRFLLMRLQENLERT